MGAITDRYGSASTIARSGSGVAAEGKLKSNAGPDRMHISDAQRDGERNDPGHEKRRNAPPRDRDAGQDA